MVFSVWVVLRRWLGLGVFRCDFLTCFDFGL